jgi:hypothetical protein
MDFSLHCHLAVSKTRYANQRFSENLAETGRLNSHTGEHPAMGFRVTVSQSVTEVKS